MILAHSQTAGLYSIGVWSWLLDWMSSSEGLTSIGDDAFASCSSLSSLATPDKFASSYDERNKNITRPKTKVPSEEASAIVHCPEEDVVMWLCRW
jgi:hypothetical protein